MHHQNTCTEALAVQIDCHHMVSLGMGIEATTSATHRRVFIKKLISFFPLLGQGKRSNN